MIDFLELLKTKLQYAGMESSEMPPDTILEAGISAAIGEINHRRNHTPSDEASVAPGFDRFVVPMAQFVILKTGAEGQAGHSENGVSRSYITDGDYPRDLLRQIMWVVR